jgi:hypothetical protein
LIKKLRGYSKVGKTNEKAKRFLIRVSKRMTAPGRPRCKQENNITTELEKEDVAERINMAQEGFSNRPL